MGPRSIDRGNFVTRTPMSIPTRLQWGRDQLIAETVLGASPEVDVGPLQWGRDQLIAETTRRGNKSARETWLQWGRDQLIAETAGFTMVEYHQG